MIDILCIWFLIFFISSVIGYIAEISFCSITWRKLVWNRGFLLGPYIPIYGVGTVLVGILLAKYRNDPLVFFCMTVILCSIIEYLTSYIMEKLFKVRWWDYSNESFNYNGRICLKNSLLFGFGGLIVIYTIYPFLWRIIRSMSPLVLKIVSLILSLILLTDFYFTTIALFRVKTNLQKYAGGDATEEIKKEVMKVIKGHNFSFYRLLHAFPKIEKFNKKELEEFKKNVIEYRKKKKEKLRSEKKC